MIEYPKIETVFDRDPETFKVRPGVFRKPEYLLITNWLVTEKIDGTNVRVGIRMDRGGTEVSFGGRSENAQMPMFLLDFLGRTFTADRCTAAFDEAWGGEEEPLEVTLFGEGYGPKIQKAGAGYRDAGPSFRLLDVRVGNWWLNWADVDDVARKLEVATVPVLHPGCSFERALELIHNASTVQEQEYTGEQVTAQEGIVARTDPLLFDRHGHRVTWKLKGRDFA